MGGGRRPSDHRDYRVLRQIALHYPLHVVMEILGVPEEDEPRMLMLTQELFGATDPELGRAPGAAAVPGDIGSIQAVLADFYQYFAKISADRRANPRDDGEQHAFRERESHESPAPRTETDADRELAPARHRARSDGGLV